MIEFITGPWNRRNGLTWLGLLILVITIRWLLIEPFKIPTGSMEPTLHGDPKNGDHVMTNKLAYGPRIPFTRTRLFHMGKPKRWDIVVFKNLDRKAKHGTLVKRVVGLPGERIHIKDGKIWVNGEAQEPPKELRDVLHYTDELQFDDADVARFLISMSKSKARSPLLNEANETAQRLYRELDAMHERVKRVETELLADSEALEYIKGLDPVSLSISRQLFSMYQKAQYSLTYGILDDDNYALVPEGHYLVCGDNSPDSADGRWFGWLPEGHIMGRAFCIWWPLSRMRDLTGFTHTWWGLGLLVGIPGGLAAYEITRTILARRKRRAANCG